jgi:hypothetical protein
MPLTQLRIEAVTMRLCHLHTERNHIHLELPTGGALAFSTSLVHASGFQHHLEVTQLLAFARPHISAPCLIATLSTISTASLFLQRRNSIAPYRTKASPSSNAPIFDRNVWHYFCAVLGRSQQAILLG